MTEPVENANGVPVIEEATPEQKQPEPKKEKPVEEDNNPLPM